MRFTRTVWAYAAFKSLPWQSTRIVFCCYASKPKGAALQPALLEEAHMLAEFRD